MPVPSQGHYGFTVFRLLTDFVCLYNVYIDMIEINSSKNVIIVKTSPPSVTENFGQFWLSWWCSRVLFWAHILMVIPNVSRAQWIRHIILKYVLHGFVIKHFILKIIRSDLMSISNRVSYFCSTYIKSHFVK